MSKMILTGVSLKAIYALDGVGPVKTQDGRQQLLPTTVELTLSSPDGEEYSLANVVVLGKRVLKTGDLGTARTRWPVPGGGHIVGPAWPKWLLNLVNSTIEAARKHDWKMHAAIDKVSESTDFGVEGGNG